MARAARATATTCLEARARAVLPGGASSSARCFGPGPPLLATRGRGPWVWDAADVSRLDLVLGFGSLLFGHGDVEVVEALARRAHAGTPVGTTTALEVEVAEQLCVLVPSLERLHFGNSGSEMCFLATRLARAATGRRRIVKFDGHYHGWIDPLYFSCRATVRSARSPDGVVVPEPHCLGIPASTAVDLTVLEWNRWESLETLRRLGPDVAAVICEPIVANNACLAPQPGFLRALREVTQAAGQVLIFDEVITGFRVAPGGAQERLEVVPDLTVLSKALGLGLPVAALGGRAGVMGLLERSVRHSGTYNGHPLALEAARVLVDRLGDSGGRLHRDLERHTERLALGVETLLATKGIDGFVSWAPGVLQPVFRRRGASPKRPVCYRELIERSDAALYGRFRSALLARGVLVTPFPAASWFLATAHGEAEVDAVLERVEGALREF